MTKKARVLAAARRRERAGKPISPAALAKRLKVPAGSVRRILGEARRSGGLIPAVSSQAQRAPSIEAWAAPTLRGRLAEYLAEGSGLVALDVEVVREAILETHGPGVLTIEEVLLTLNTAQAPVAGPWVRPMDLARMFGEDPGSTRAALLEFERTGRAEHDPSRPAAAGRWRGLTRPEGYTEEDLRQLLPSDGTMDRRSQNRQGLRLFQSTDGDWYVVAFDPDESTPEEEPGHGGAETVEELSV